jgi:ABC-2 type transport system permease protein
MPIHDQSYRRYGGQRERPGGAWTVIARSGIRTLITQRRFLFLLIVAWLPFLFRAVQIYLAYLAADFPQADIFRPSPETFRDFLDQQGLLLIFVTLYVGAGLIANDRRANALQIYLSKPLTRAEYIGGKLAVLAAFQLLVTWVPAMLLLLLQVVFAGSFTFIGENLFLIPAITLFASVLVLLAAFTMLALSSLSNSSRFVAILYASVVFFSDRMFDAQRLMTGGTNASWISVRANVAQMGDVIFRLQPRYDTPWTLSMLVIIGWICLSIVILERRVRGVEVVT